MEPSFINDLAVEIYQKKKRADMDMFSQALWMEKNPGQGEIFKNAFELYIKDTIEDELADAIIRLLDLSATLDIDIEEHIRLKMQYNKTREYKHGKLY